MLIFNDKNKICDACHVSECIIKKSKFEGFVKLCQNTQCCLYKETQYTLPNSPNI